MKPAASNDTQAYDPPRERAPADVVRHVPEWRVTARRAYMFLAVGFFALVGTGAIIQAGPIAMGAGAVATALCSLACWNAIRSLSQMSGTPAFVALSSKAGIVTLPLLTGLAMTGFGFLMTVFSAGFARGRQLRRLGKVQLADVAADDAWSKLTHDIEVPADVRAELARRWRWNALTEHASVAAFAQVSLDLLALGAPPRLLEAANRDAKDEIRHAELCFAIARSLDGLREGPAPFPPARRLPTQLGGRTMRLARLAVTSLVDGVLHEGLSARVLARLGPVCEDPSIKQALRDIAADEGRHAAHAWDVVEWCVEAGGSSIGAALSGALAGLSEDVMDDLPARAIDGSWQRFGIPGAALEAEEYVAACAQLSGRVAGLRAQAYAA